MKKILTNKKFITIIFMIIAGLFILVGTSGCNKQIFDFEYSYDKAICNIGDEVKEIKIDKWKDYDEKQLQIKGTDGNTYLVSSVNCTFIKER